MPQVSINIANRTYELACGEGVAATGLHGLASENQRRFLTGSKRVWHRSPTI